MINFIGLDNVVKDNKGQTAYTRARFSYMCQFEGVKTYAYRDKKGIPTIGIGFNLRDDNILELVLKAFGMDAPKGSALHTAFKEIAAKSYVNNTDLQTELNTEMAKQYAAHTANRSTFDFAAGDTGKEEMRATFDTAVKIYDEGYPAAKIASDKLGRVNAWLAGIPPSYERIALVDMSYNGLINSGFSPSLRDAVLKGNRAEAWYQIRYTYKESDQLFKRRYADAALFGLYDDPKSTTLVEAFSIYRMYTIHRDNIFKYEAKYGIKPDGNNGSVDNYISKAKEDLVAAGMGSVVVSDLGHTLLLAGQKLVAEYSQYIENPIRGGDVANNTINTLNIQVTSPGKTPSKFTLTGEAAATKTGSNNDLLIGTEGQADHLDGKGGNDVLIGGSGDDTLTAGTGHSVLVGGEGNDIYILKGDGNSSYDIEDKAGDNTIRFNGHYLTAFIKDVKNGGSLISPDGIFTAIWSNTDLIVTEVATGATATLNKDFQSGDFGIKLYDEAPAAAPTSDYAYTSGYSPVEKTVTVTVYAGYTEPYLQSLLPANTFLFSVSDWLTQPSASTPGTLQLTYWERDKAGNYILDTSSLGGPHPISTINGTNGNDTLTLSTGGWAISNPGGTDTIIGSNSIDYISVADGNNLIIGNGSPTSLPPGSGGFTNLGDVILAGNGNNRIYANTQVDLATALTQQKTLTPTGQQGDLIAVGSGNNTIVGGTGNDLIISGGNTTVVLGPGNNTFVGGETVKTTLPGTDIITQNTWYWWSSQNGVSTSNNVPQYTLSMPFIYAQSSGGYSPSAQMAMLSSYGQYNFDNAWGRQQTLDITHPQVVSISSNKPDAFYIDSNLPNAIHAPAGVGSDTIFCGSGNNLIIGSNGGNTIVVGSGNNNLFSGGGNDTITGSTGNSLIDGQGGDDFISVDSGNNRIWGGAGNNTIYGGSGNDTIYVGINTTLNTGNNTVYTGPGNATIFGSGGNDSIVVGSGNCTVYGGAGTQIMYAGSGHATLIAGTGNNALYGGSGTDVLKGSTGNTQFFAGSGSETIVGGSGANTYYFDTGFGNVSVQNAKSTDQFIFGPGVDISDLAVSRSLNNDLFIQTNNGGSLTIEGGLNKSVGTFQFADATPITLTDFLSQCPVEIIGTDGVDTLIGTQYADVLHGLAGDDTLIGGSGNDTYLYSLGDGADTLADGGWAQGWDQTGQPVLMAEINTLSFGADITADMITPLWNGNTITLDLGNGDSIAIGSLTDLAMQTLRFDDDSTVAIDEFLAQQGLIQLTGTAGNDIMATFGNSQPMQGLGGDDQIYGSVLNDTLEGGIGNDTLIGAGGDNTYLYNLGDGADTIVDSAIEPYSPSAYTNTLSFGAGITAESVTPVYDSGSQTLMLDLGNGDSIAIGSLGDLAIQNLQFAGGSSLTVGQLVEQHGGLLQRGTDEPDELFGTEFADRLEGLGGDDTLTGNNGNDMLIGGHGNDVLDGGVGDDLYVFNHGDGADIINDRSWNWGGPGGEFRIAETNTLLLGAGITPVMVAAVVDLDGMVNLDFGGGDSVSIGSKANSTIQEIKFFNGDAYSIADVWSGSIFPSVITRQNVLLDAPFNFTVPQNPFVASHGATYTYIANLADGSALPSWLGFDVVTQTFSGVPSNGDVGVFGVRVTATDADGLSASSTFVLDVMYVNDAPTVANALTDQIVYLATQFSFVVPANTFSDADFVHGDRLSYTATLANGNPLPIWLTFDAATQSFSGVPGDGDVGNFSLVVTATDADGMSAINGFTLQVGYIISTDDGQGNATLTTFDGNGIVLSDSWSHSDGSSGTDTFNADGSHSSNSVDGFGNTSTANYDANGNKLSDFWQSSNGDSSSHTYSYDTAGTLLSSTWQNSSGSHSIDFYIADGSVSGTAYYPDGGYDTYIENVDGSGSGSEHNADGSYDTYTYDGHGNNSDFNYDADGNLIDSHVYSDDGLGNSTSAHFDANGFKLSDGWRHADGSYGGDTFNADGSSSGYSNNPDGTYSNYTNDGQGTVTTVNYDASETEVGYSVVVSDGQGNSTTTNFDANDIKLSDIWYKGNGSFGTDTYNADGSSSGNTQNVDGSYATHTNDGQGNSTLTAYDANGTKLSDSWTHSDGSFGTDTFNADGSYSNTSVDAWSNASAESYDANGHLLSKSWLYSNGYSNSETYDTNGNRLSSAWHSSDGAYGADTYNADGSSSGEYHDVDGRYDLYTDDGQGNYTDLYYDANGTKLSDYWEHSDGLSGDDTYNPDGSSSGTTYNLDGSLSSYTNDGQGDATTSNYDINGNLAQTEAVTFNTVDGSTDDLRTFNVDGSLKNETLIITSADGSEVDTQWDTNGDGQMDKIEWVTNFDTMQFDQVDNYNPDGSLKDRTWTMYNTDIANSVYSEYTTYDFNGDGNNDEIRTVTPNEDGSTTVDVSNLNLDGTTKDETITTTSADGSHVIYYNDGQGNTTTTNFDANDIKLSDIWYKGNGSFGDDTFNADGSSSGNISNADGSSSSYIHDGHGNNTLIAGLGVVTLVGGTGNNTFVVNNIHDVVQAQSTGSNTNTILTSVDFVTPANVQNLTLTGTANINGTGNELANLLTGNTGNNILDGGVGADTMAGGQGNDTYIVDNTGDVFTENLTEGTDTVQSSIAYTLGANVENLTLTGTAAINGNGNGLANALYGNSGANTLYGLDGNDTLYASNGDFAFGGNGDDILIAENTAGSTLDHFAYLRGDGGNDNLTGGAGSNQIWGGSGNDTITGGSSYNYIWGDNGGGVNGDDVIYGGAVYDLVLGGGGNDYIAGNGGDDYLMGDGGNDVVQGGDDNDTITDQTGNNLLDGGTGADSLIGGVGNELFIGGTGYDTITTGTGADLIAFNKGDGQDTVNASTGADNILSLGGGIKLDSLAFSKTGNDLIFNTGNSEQITLKDWYLGTTNHSIVTLQVIEAAAADYNPTGSDTLRDNKVETFNFATLTSNFDTALAATPTLTSWSLMDSLLTTHLTNSDTAALGGDLAYQYGTAGSLAGVGLGAAQDVLANAGSLAQTLRPLATVSSGLVKLS